MSRCVPAWQWMAARPTYHDKHAERSRTMYGEDPNVPPPKAKPITLSLDTFVFPTIECSTAIQNAREEIGMTRTRLASLSGARRRFVEYAELGVRQTFQRRVRLHQLQDIARIFDIPVTIIEGETRELRVRV